VRYSSAPACSPFMTLDFSDALPFKLLERGDNESSQATEICFGLRPAQLLMSGAMKTAFQAFPFRLIVTA
jgi:hypothetical protein